MCEWGKEVGRGQLLCHPKESGLDPVTRRKPLRGLGTKEKMIYVCMAIGGKGAGGAHCNGPGGR